MKDNIGNVGSDDEFCDEAFREIFMTFDLDGSGTIEKSEMFEFIKQLLMGNVGDSNDNGNSGLSS